MNSIKLQDIKLIYRNPLHFYRIITNYQKVKKIPFIVTSMRKKYLGINEPREVKGLYSENYRH